MSKSAGYYMEPTIYDETIVFVSDDDLWAVGTKGGQARRLTSVPGIVSTPRISPDGEWTAFIGRIEGYPEVYVIPSAGGKPRRISYNGGRMCKVLGWSRDGNSVIFATPAGRPFYSLNYVYSMPLDGGPPEKLPCGPAASISFGPQDQIVLGRHGRDPAQWKRYRGGRMGRIWIDREGDGKFELLLDIESNMAFPMWIKDRIYFLSDHEGIANIYSCNLIGERITRHTDHEEFYARNPSTDGKNIAYHAGGDLYVLNIKNDEINKVDVDFRSSRTQIAGRYLKAGKYFETFDLHPKVHSLAFTSRGKPFTMGLWEGPSIQHGLAGGAVRYRLAKWLNDGRRLVAVSDEGDEEALEIFPVDDSEMERIRLDGMDIGRPVLMEVSPVNDEVVLTNHRKELLWINLKKKTMRMLDKSMHIRIYGISWSPDGRWVAYMFGVTHSTSIIKICRIETGETFEVTEPVLIDSQPSFDPEGRYLYFISNRIFDPVPDQHAFDYNFPKGQKPMLITLRKDVPSPFLPAPKPLEEDEKSDKKEGKDSKGKKSDKIEIHFDGIKRRLLSFPVPEGIYGQISGNANKVFFSSFPIKGTINRSIFSTTPEANGSIEYYDFTAQKKESFVSSVTSFSMSKTGKTLAYRSGNKLRVLKTEEKPDEKLEKEPPGRKSGWIDLNRARLWIYPHSEWKQMYRETWRLLREHYFTENMADVDWNKIYERYLPLIDRLSARYELSDLLWELGGELGTSHAYEIGGDYPSYSRPSQGYLAADFSYDERKNGYRIDHIVQGDSWDRNEDSPLNQPGLNVSPGDVLLAVNGRKLHSDNSPNELLIDQGGMEALLTIAPKRGKQKNITVKTLRDDMPARLREWIRNNTEYVHKKTKEQVGYIYLPDMSPPGFAEFHRAFLSEVHRDALIVDVRNNSGGAVSPIIVEKLSRKRVGYNIQRWGEIEPTPTEAVKGPIVCLTDEFGGSDGDIFSHVFKQLKLGLLIGKRTWGGIVGLNPTHPLVDGSITTQPEFFNWFDDVGWGLENRGAEPDIIVEYKPQDYEKGVDPQLDRGIKEILKQLKAAPPSMPDFGKPPSRATPKLPPKTTKKKSGKK